jgi:hypothetical protein
MNPQQCSDNQLLGVVQSRRAAVAAELNRKALGLSDGPSREERMMRRSQLTGNDDFYSGKFFDASSPQH